jgi:hypothetical protein
LIFAIQSEDEDEDTPEISFDVIQPPKMITQMCFDFAL